jgi:hypothetical protein
MPPEFVEDGKSRKHPLEDLFNASGWDILSAIQQGHRARTDAKGKLAEWFLYKQITDLVERKVFKNVSWTDEDGIPDFLIEAGSEVLRVECKNVRSGSSPRKYAGFHRIEIQKTRNAIGGGPGRSYRVDEFDIIAACLFNQTGKWEYLFVATRDLARRPDHPEYLEIFHPVPYIAQGVWKGTLEEVTRELIPGV